MATIMTTTTTTIEGYRVLKTIGHVMVRDNDLYKVQEALTKKTSDLGANAVIDLKMHTSKDGKYDINYVLIGTAVVMEKITTKVTPKTEVRPKKTKRTPKETDKYLELEVGYPMGINVIDCI